MPRAPDVQDKIMMELAYAPGLNRYELAARIGHRHQVVSHAVEVLVKEGRVSASQDGLARTGHPKMVYALMDDGWGHIFNSSNISINLNTAFRAYLPYRSEAPMFYLLCRIYEALVTVRAPRAEETVRDALIMFGALSKSGLEEEKALAAVHLYIKNYWASLPPDKGEALWKQLAKIYKEAEALPEVKHMTQLLIKGVTPPKQS